MERETKRLAAVLHQIAYDAGYVLLCRGDPETVRFCIDQYNRVHARLSEVNPALTAPFGRLPDDASAGEIRIVARALVAYIREKTRKQRKQTRVGVGCIGFVWPGCSLKFDLC